MLHKLSQFFYKRENRRNNLIFLSLTLITTIIFQFVIAYMSQLAGKAIQPLDMGFFFSAVQAYQQIHTYNSAVINFYIPFELTADIWYPIVYSIYFTLLLSFLLKKNFSNYNSLTINAFPLLSGLFDVLENVGIVTLLTNYPTQIDWLANLAGVFNGMKWVLAFIIVLTVLILSIRLIVKPLQTK